jgi:hypothetical protein
MEKSYYAIVPASVRYDEKLCPNAKLLYGEITALCNDKGYCWANNRYFSVLYNVSVRSVINWIRELETANHIVISTENENSKRYIMLTDDVPYNTYRRKKTSRTP